MGDAVGERHQSRSIMTNSRCANLNIVLAIVVAPTNCSTTPFRVWLGLGRGLGLVHESCKLPYS